jgi:hypothetical protein
VVSAIGAAEGFHVAWNASTGLVYQVQCTTNLFPPNWVNFGAPISAPVGPLTVNDTNACQSAPSRFYRVLVVP